MYTLEQVTAAILQLWNDDDPESPIDSYEGELLDAEGEAEQVLIDLDVPDAEDRIEWYNTTRLDAEDIQNLANVEFSVTKCDNCGEKQMYGNPLEWGNFQGVCQSEGLLGITLEPLGTTGDLCGECIGTIERMLL